MTEDIKTLQDLITGLEGNLKGLRADKEMFVRAQGMDIEAEKLKAEAQKFNSDISIHKMLVKDLQAKKAAAITPAIEGMSKAMDAFLSQGNSILKIEEDGTFSIGWGDVLYPSLSGGEKVMFDVALAKALGAKILVVEGAEIDPENLNIVLNKYAKSGIDQVIISTCYGPKEVPKGWEVTRL